VKITNAQKSFEVIVLENSQIENFNFTNSSITAAILGEMIFAKNWTYKNFTISVSQKPEEKKKVAGIEEQERLKQ
jgi:hypothetical protein